MHDLFYQIELIESICQKKAELRESSNKVICDYCEILYRQLWKGSVKIRVERTRSAEPLNLSVICITYTQDFKAHKIHVNFIMIYCAIPLAKQLKLVYQGNSREIQLNPSLQ